MDSTCDLAPHDFFKIKEKVSCLFLIDVDLNIALDLIQIQQI
jgi:hypothetical protein